MIVACEEEEVVGRSMSRIKNKVAPHISMRKTRKPSVVRVLCNSTMLEERKRRLSALSTMSLTSLDDSSLEQEGQPLVDDSWSNIAWYIDYYELSSEQEAKLLDLKQRVCHVTHIHNTPMWLIRYLITKQYNVDAAEAMMIKTVKWRVENGVDTILTDYKPPAGLQNKYPGAILKEADKEGDPIFINRTGVTDLPGLVDTYGTEELLKYEVYRRESVMVGPWIDEWEKKKGRPVRAAILIEDLHGLSRHTLASRALKYYGQVTELDGAYYSEINKKIIIIRAPTVFRMAWSIVKRFFDPHIVDKMEFCGDKDYLQVLEKYVDLEVLPPCIYPQGHGEAVDGHPKNFEGGRV